MLPSGITKASGVAATPPYYLAWSDAFIAVDFEAITLPLLFSDEDVYRGYHSTMRRMHSRKVSEWERMNVHYTRARKCYRTGQFVDCVTSLQHACLMRREVFATSDYQVGAAYEHAAWAAIHLALIRIGETDGKRSAANADPSDGNLNAKTKTNGGDATDNDDDDADSYNSDDSDDKRRKRTALDAHNPNEVHKLFSIAEQLLKTCAAKRRSPLDRLGTPATATTSVRHTNSSHNTSNHSTAGGGGVGGGVFRGTDISSTTQPLNSNGRSATTAATIFPNKTLLEFVLFHNVSNYWVRRRKWKAARKYTALAEARFRTLSHKGMVRCDDVLPSSVCGITAAECFLRCRSELVRLRSQFVSGGGSESLLFQKPISTHPRPAGMVLSGSDNTSNTAATDNVSSATFLPNGTMGAKSGSATAESFLSGFSLGAGTATSSATAAGGNACLVSLELSTCPQLAHSPMVNKRLLPSTLCGDAVALAWELEERHRQQEEDEAAVEIDGTKFHSGESSTNFGANSDPAARKSQKITPQAVMLEGVLNWLRLNPNSPDEATDAHSEDKAKEGTVRSDSQTEVNPYPYLHPYPYGVPITAVAPLLAKDGSFTRHRHEREMFERLLATEERRHAEEQTAYDAQCASAAAAGQEVPPSTINKTSNTNTIKRFEDARDGCTAAMNERCAFVAQRAVEGEGFLKFQIWCSPSETPPPSVSVPPGASADSPARSVSGMTPEASGGPTANPNGGVTSDGLWCDVAMSFVVARREFSSPDHWSPLRHTIPFYYHYTCAVFAYNERKFALGLRHLETCARIVLGTETEAAPLQKLKSLHTQQVAAARREVDQEAGAAQSEPAPAQLPLPSLSTYFETNPYWWEKGVVTLRHHCVEVPSLYHFSKYNTTKAAINNPTEAMRKQIMMEHVAAEQARKRRLLQEEVQRNRMLHEEGGDTEVVDAVDESTGRPAWGIQPSLAETTSIVNQLAEYSDNLKLWRDRRGLPPPQHGRHIRTSNEEGEDEGGTCTTPSRYATESPPPNSAPAAPASSVGPNSIMNTNDNNNTTNNSNSAATGATHGDSQRAQSNPSSETLQKLTFSQKQAQRASTGGSPLNGPPTANRTTSSVRPLLGGGVGAGGSVAARRGLPRPQPLPMLREIASDVMTASKLRRQLHQKQRSGSLPSATATINRNDNEDELVHAESNSSAAQATSARSNNHNNVSANNATNAVKTKASPSARETIFLSVHNRLVDSLIQRQEQQLSRDLNGGQVSAAQQSASAAVSNEASAGLPAPSSDEFGIHEAGVGASAAMVRPTDAADSSHADAPAAATPVRRASLFAVEERFDERRRAAAVAKAGGLKTLTSNGGEATIDASRAGSPRGAPLLSLYGGIASKTERMNALLVAQQEMPTLDKSPLRIRVEVPTDEEMLRNNCFGPSAQRKATTPFGLIRPSAMLPPPIHNPHHGHQGGGGVNDVEGVAASLSSTSFTFSSPNQPPALGRSPLPTLLSPAGTNGHTASPTGVVRVLHTKGSPETGNPAANSYNNNNNNTPPQTIALSASPIAQSGQSVSSSNAQFRIDGDRGAVVGVKRYNLVPHLESIAEKQHALRAMLPAVDFRQQRDLYRTIVAELAENEEILRLRRVEMQQRVLRYEADKLRLLAVQQQVQSRGVIGGADIA